MFTHELELIHGLLNSAIVDDLA